MTHPNGTTVAVLTSPGRGAIATILVAGDNAAELVGRSFHHKAARGLADDPIGRIAVGRWGTAEPGEEVVVARRAPDRVEVHCHGGRAAADSIVRSLVALGCRQIGWRDALRDSARDPLSAQAEIALCDAPTLRSAQILWDQCAGALAAAVDTILALIQANDMRAALERLDVLIARGDLGRHLTHPWRVVLAGRPNVGKSSLLNALCGYERAIVHDTPGTTRDLVTADTAIDGWPVQLADTAGLHQGSDRLEVAGIELARSWLSAADLVLTVVDRSQPITPPDEQLMAEYPAAIVVANKCDLPAAESQSAMPAGAICVSAVARLGLDALERAISRRLVPRPPKSGEAVPFAALQRQAIELAAQLVRGGNGVEAAGLLAELRHGGRAC